MDSLSAVGKGIRYVASGIHLSPLSLRIVCLLTLAHPLVSDTDILHLKIPGTSIIILNTHEAATELLYGAYSVKKFTWSVGKN